VVTEIEISFYDNIGALQGQEAIHMGAVITVTTAGLLLFAARKHCRAGNDLFHDVLVYKMNKWINRPVGAAWPGCFLGLQIMPPGFGEQYTEKRNYLYLISGRWQTASTQKARPGVKQGGPSIENYMALPAQEYILSATITGAGPFTADGCTKGIRILVAVIHPYIANITIWHKAIIIGAIRLAPAAFHFFEFVAAERHSRSNLFFHNCVFKMLRK
jgi:hypothetical protein